MLDRVAVEQDKTFADIVLDFVPGEDTGRPDLVEVTASAASIRVRLRLHANEIEDLAVALDSAVTGGTGELYFRPDAVPTDAAS